jgi:porin
MVLPTTIWQRGRNPVLSPRTLEHTMFCRNEFDMMSGRPTGAGLLLTAALLLVAVQASFAQEAQESDQVSRPRFGGPDAVHNLIESDRRADQDVLFETSAFDSFGDWQAGIAENNGFSFGTGYTANYFSGSASLPGRDDYSSGGMLRLFGNWELFGRGGDNTGTLSFKLDHRHSYTDIVPNLYSLDSLGYVDSMASTFSDEKWRLTNLHWRQSWNNGNVVLLTGLISAPDFLDVYTLGSPWVHFQSLAFTTGAGTISLPGDAALGAMVGGWLNENLYILGGFEDANSVASDFFKSFDTVSQGEFFKHIEVGWTTSTDRAYLDNVHLTFWHSDERKEAGVPSGQGAVFSFTHYFAEKWMPFFRAGYAKDGASFLERSVSAGLAYQPNPIGASAGNLLGIGVNWGKPNEAVYGPGLRNQQAIELFYRLQVTKQLAITPDIQLVKNPALNPGESSIWVLNLRARFSL